MKNIVTFSREKFLSLPIKTQHRQCASFLQHIVEDEENTDELLHHYKELRDWMQLQQINLNTKKELLKAYSQHLEEMQEYRELPQQDLPIAKKPFLNIHTYLEDLRSAHNIGNIIRTAEAFRIGPVHISRPVNLLKIKKSAMGAENWVSITHTVDILSLPKPLLAVEITPFSVDYTSFSFPESCTIILGNEAYGVSENTLEQVDYTISIPLYGRKHSLNVANAYAIIASRIAEQHHFS